MRVLIRPALIAIFLFFLLVSAACNSVSLDERFLDNRLTNWTVVDDPDTVEIPSNWQVEEDGWLHQRSNIWGKRGDFLGRWYGTFLVTGDVSWSDYRFSVKAKPIDNDGFGVVFRYTDERHFYRLLLLNDGLSGGPLTRLDKREGDDYTEIWSAPAGFRKEAEVTIEVEVDGELITVWVEGGKLFEARDAAYRRGKVGLFCYAQSHQMFDNVRVVRL